jgi:NAD(P)-dependent dehydrogenase (short-subunit alcohol dehydrogenase family)
VRYFASQNATISILDISANAAESVLSSLKTEFPNSKFLFKKCDISNWDEQAAVFKEVYEEVGSVDVVFANAGVSEKGRFLEKEDGEPKKPELRTLDVNLSGTLFCEF